MPCIPASREITVSFEATDHLPLLSEKYILAHDTQRVYQMMPGVRDHLLPYTNNKVCFARSWFADDQIKILADRRQLDFANVFSIWDFLHLEEILLEEDALIFHCCFCEMNGEAILFSAPSGTGKTTQGNFWKELYGARIINGDRCCLKKINGLWHACGFPLHGTAAECLNEAYPIKAIVVLKQGSVNKLEKLHSIQKMVALYNETVVNNWNPVFRQKVFDLIGEIVESVPIIEEQCILSPSAAELCHDYLFEGSEKDGVV